MATRLNPQPSEPIPIAIGTIQLNYVCSSFNILTHRKSYGDPVEPSTLGADPDGYRDYPVELRVQFFHYFFTHRKSYGDPVEPSTLGADPDGYRDYRAAFRRAANRQLNYACLSADKVCKKL